MARDDDKSSLCSLRQLRSAIMENCRHAFHITHHPFHSRAVGLAEIVYPLTIKNGYFLERFLFRFLH